MTNELDKKLCEKYPKIFRNRRGDMRTTCMCWGCECSDGWYNLIDSMCEAMTYAYETSIEVDASFARKHGIKDNKYSPGRYFLDVKPPQVIADQVKEKFGALRFYYHLEFDPMLVEYAETKEWSLTAALRYIFRKLCKKHGEYSCYKHREAREIMEKYSNYMEGIVHYAEVLSGRTCEETGKEGEMHTSGGWYKTLNREYAKTNEFCVSRHYVPFADLKKEELA